MGRSPTRTRPAPNIKEKTSGTGGNNFRISAPLGYLYPQVLSAMVYLVNIFRGSWHLKTTVESWPVSPTLLTLIGPSQ